MFKNYFRDPMSDTPLNLGIARVVFSLYLLWKIGSERWHRLSNYPKMRDGPDSLWWLLPEFIIRNIELVALVALLFVALVAVGLYIRVTAFAASFLVCYLGIVRDYADGSWSTDMFFAASILLLLFALYDEQHRLSLDELRRYSRENIDSLNRHLTQPRQTTYPATPMVVFLLAMGIIYFGAAVGKLINSGVGWVSPTNQGRYLYDHTQIGYIPEVQEFAAQHELLLVLGGVGTLAAQLGLLTATVSGRFFSLSLLGLLGFHLATAIAMGPVFLYTAVFLLLFIDWEKFVSSIQSGEELIVVYDGECLLCARVMYLFKCTDVNDTIQLYTQSDVPDHKYDIADTRQTIYVFEEDHRYEDTDAFKRLCRQVKLLSPLALLMRVPGVSPVGKRIYWYLTDDVSQGIEPEEQSGRENR